MVKIPKQIVIKSEKICSYCGNYTGAYIVWKNACICNFCAKEYVLLEEKQKKIPNEKTMLTKILGNKNL